MGLLDFIFGKDPDWEEVSKNTFSSEDIYIYSKSESKQLFQNHQHWFCGPVLRGTGGEQFELRKEKNAHGLRGDTGFVC